MKKQNFILMVIWLMISLGACNSKKEADSSSKPKIPAKQNSKNQSDQKKLNTKDKAAPEKSRQTKKKKEPIFQVVEEMPYLISPNCEHQDRSCAKKEMMAYVYQQLNYPSIAKTQKIEGVVVITFVIEKDSIISQPRIAKDIGGQCGQEALKIVKQFNKNNFKWQPGLQNGKKQRVQYNLPIRFKL